jgi:lactate dehydrogenase-like 2-hydroxyacid dehydrogenase
MPIKVVVLDAGQLPAGVEFPPLEVAKYGWEQYPALSGEEIPERCWRADIIVSLGTAIDRRILEKLHRLKLLIGFGEVFQSLDQELARTRGVELLAFQEPISSESGAVQVQCNQVSQAIEHYLRNSENPGEQP